MIESRSLLLSSLKNGLMHQSKSVDVKIVDNEILKCLYKYNLITHVINNTSHQTIYINNSIFKKIQLTIYNRKHSKIKLSPTQITKLKLHMQESIYLFSTPRGFLNQHEMIAINTSGFLIFQIHGK